MFMTSSQVSAEAEAGAIPSMPSEQGCCGGHGHRAQHHFIPGKKREALARSMKLFFISRVVPSRTSM